MDRAFATSCEVCGKEGKWVSKNGKGRPPKTCSDECKLEKRRRDDKARAGRRPPCQIRECDTKADGLLKYLLCTKHSQRLDSRWSTHDPNTIDSRFWDKCLIVDSGCWEWQGFINPGGYGQFGSESGKIMLAHRWSYQRFVGGLVDGLEIDHLCRNTKCCNPKHLEQVTRAVNMDRTVGLKFTHYAIGDREFCSKGHAMTDDNRRKRKERVNSWVCKTCMQEYHRERNRRLSGER